MTNTEIIEATRAYVAEKFSGEGSGHDYWHMYRVWQLSRTILKTEPAADTLTTELAALLHDIADWKFHDGDEEAGPKAARDWLENLKVEESVISAVEHVVRNVSFKGANEKSKLMSLEGYIVHDADKLDAIGAIGIARTFAYGGASEREIYNPDRKPQEYANAEEYRKNDSPTINHFYEKLLLLKDIMFTKTGKQMAQHRHEYMEQFLKEFYDEWDGKL